MSLRLASLRANRNGNCPLATTLGLKSLVILGLAAGLLCMGAQAQQSNQKDGQKADEKAIQKADKKEDQAKAPTPQASKGDIRNNAASLLDDLLGQEKNLSKILIIKHPPAAVGQLLKAISKEAGDGHDKLQALAKANSSLNLQVMQLPPGEVAARAADAKEQEHQLLSSSGTKFAFAVLLTQYQALSYGSNLAKVAADNSSSADESKEFQGLNTRFNNLLEQVQTQIRTLPK
jgi:hypothetical protein